MSELKKVVGQDCLNYISKDVGIASHNNFVLGHDQIMSYVNSIKSIIYGRMDNQTKTMDGFAYDTTVIKWHNDKTKRVVGLVTGKSDDGGIRVAILGNNLTMVNRDNRNDELVGGCEFCHVKNVVLGVQGYSAEALPPFDYYPTKDYELFPAYRDSSKLPYCYVIDGNATGANTSYEQALNLVPTFDKFLQTQVFGSNIWYQGSVNPRNAMTITTNKNSTVVAGEIYNLQGEYEFPDFMCEHPLKILSGNLYEFMTNISMMCSGFLSTPIEHGTDFNDILDRPIPTQPVSHSNWCTYPFNLILTENEYEALNYINNGVLPSDAYLYPLDWNSLPTYKNPDDGDDTDDGDNPDDYNDDDRDIEPTPLNVPLVTPQNLSTNNVYWLGVGEFGQFLTWFWYDIQEFSILDPTTWDDLINNVKGLYNDLASTILSVRVMPVRPEWCGGLDENQESIKLGMIEDTRTHNIFNRLARLEPQKLGKIKIPAKFDSFLDVAPYSQLMVYLPFYGYVDLDIDLFSDHELHVYAVYDILSGTISYFLYYDDTALINFYMAKMSVDVPITLQTAYDRDRSVKENVVNFISSNASALTSTYFRSPVGITMSMKDLAHHSMDAPPMVAKGMGGEQGSLFEPTKCFILLRRPTIPNIGDSYSKAIGFLVNKTFQLSDLADLGFTICARPIIEFNGNEYIDENGVHTGKMILPLREEIEEIYSMLEEGVIL